MSRGARFRQVDAIGVGQLISNVNSVNIRFWMQKDRPLIIYKDNQYRSVISRDMSKKSKKCTNLPRSTV